MPTELAALTADPVLLALVVWLTQISREVLALRGRYLPLVATAVALVLVLGKALAPREAEVVIGALALAALATAAVRFTKTTASTTARDW